jgi:hypothetical protein
MREFNPFILAKLGEEPLKTFTLMFLDLESGPVYLSTLPYSVTFDGNVYSSDLGIIGYTTPIQSSNVNKQSFSISISDNLSYFKSSVIKSNAGRVAKMYFGFFNSDGTPNLLTENLVMSYSGFIDSAGYTNDFSEATFTVELSSPMADLSLVNSLVTSPSGMDQINTTDTSFDNVLVDNEQILKWGKE